MVVILMESIYRLCHEWRHDCSTCTHCTNAAFQLLCVVSKLQQLVYRSILLFVVTYYPIAFYVYLFLTL